MATQSPGFSVPLADLAATLLGQQEVSPRARSIAAFVMGLLPEVAVVVYAVHDQDEPEWKPAAVLGEVALQEASVEFAAGTLGALSQSREPSLYEAKDVSREDYAHLNIRRTVQSLAYIPLVVEETTLVGAIEIISFGKPLTEAGIAPVLEVSELLALAMASAILYQTERNQQLESITRVTQMYDLEKVFNSTLEIDALVPIICSKFQEILDVEAVNLWLVEDESLLLMGQAGRDPRFQSGATQKAGEGIAWGVSESGEALCIDDSEDKRLKTRNQGVGADDAVLSLMASPLMQNESVTGVVEVFNKRDGTAFDEDDLFLLTNVSEAAAGALHNASLLQSERKVEILETLVKVSQEITSTLNLERVLQAVVNGPNEVIPYERAAIALEQHGKLHLRAVSGMKQISPGDPEVRKLDTICHWVSVFAQELYVTQRGEEIEDQRPEVRERFRQYFEESGVRGFYGLPLSDDQGHVGILLFESSDPDFLTTAHFEMIKVVAGQATVAIRNAELYKEVPLIGLIAPLMRKKDQFLSLEKRRRMTTIVLSVAAVVFLVVVPWKMRVDGEATVASAQVAQIQPEVDSVVKKVYVREGDPVTKGTILADMEDWQYRSDLAAAQAKYETALSAANRALAANDGTEAGIQRVQADYWNAEVGRARERLDKTHLRSPIDGVVATPHVENFVGKHLEQGDSFAEVIDNKTATVNVAIDEQDVPLLEAGAPAVVKLESFPTTFRGEVTVVSPKSQAEADHRYFFARVKVPNTEGALRAGMQGRGKVSVGWRPIGYVLFRRIAMWGYTKLWNWFGW